MTATAARSSLTALRHVLLHTMLAVLLATVLGAAVPLLAGGVPDGTAPSDRTSYALDLAGTEGADAEALLRDCRAARPDAEFGLRSREGDVWLVTSRFDGRLPPAAAARWTGQVRTEPALVAFVTDVLEDPATADELLTRLAPWMVLASGLSLLAVGLLAARARRREASEPPPLSTARRIAVGVAVGAALLAVTLVVDRLLSLVGLEQREQRWLPEALRAGGWTTAATVLLVVGLAPLAEETFFRRYAFAHLRGHTGRGTAYAVSAGLFAAVHLNPAASVAYFVYGLGLAAAWDRTRSLLVCSVAHATVNATAVALLLAG